MWERVTDYRSAKKYRIERAPKSQSPYTVQVTRVYDVRQKTIVCSRVDKGAEQNVGIEIKLLILFYPQTDSQTERMNQELKQYLQFFIYKQKSWSEQLVIAEFSMNNKTHSATKVSLFIVNYSKELRIGQILEERAKQKKQQSFLRK